MTKTTKIVLSSVAGLVLVIGGSIGYVVSAKFTAEKFEQGILAQDEQMQNVWGMMEGSLKMQGFTVENYSKTFIDSIKANALRYENDKGGMMKWVKEAQSQMSPKAHTKFMDAVERAFLMKEMAQKSKISHTQEYRTYISSSIKGTLSHVIFNYPTEKATKIMDRIISTKGTKKTWETGNDEVTNPFK